MKKRSPFAETPPTADPVTLSRPSARKNPLEMRTIARSSNVVHISAPITDVLGRVTFAALQQAFSSMPPHLRWAAFDALSEDAQASAWTHAAAKARAEWDRPR